MRGDAWRAVGFIKGGLKLDRGDQWGDDVDHVAAEAMQGLRDALSSRRETAPGIRPAIHRAGGRFPRRPDSRLAASPRTDGRRSARVFAPLGVGLTVLRWILQSIEPAWDRRHCQLPGYPGGRSGRSAAWISALAWGARGHRFKSGRPDCFQTQIPPPVAEATGDGI